MIRLIRRPVLLLSIIIVAAIGVAAIAQQIGELSLEAKFKKFDKNGDGKLTADELPPNLMSKLDLNKDGVVTLDEARQALAATAQSDDAPFANRLFDRFDKDGDGKVTREETGNAPWFDRLDRNKDGVITRDEVLAAAAQIKQALAKNSALLNPPPSEPVKPVALGPKALKGGDVGVGRQVPDVTFADLDGKTRKLSELARDKKGLVIVFTSTTCPVSKRYTPSLARLEKDLQSKGIGMLFVDPMKSETVADMKAQGFASLYAQDAKGTLVAALDARTTTEVFLIDSARTLLYRGALDDQYGIAYNLDAPQQRYLLEAIDDVLAGRHPHVAATEAPGCELDRPERSVAATTNVTYHRDVERILAQNCLQCHHEGGIAPFALDNVDEVKDRVKTIKRVVDQGTMPPWFAKDDKPNRWANDHSLAGRDKADLLAWIDSADRPMGDPADAPLPITFPKGGWMYGEPDAVYEFAKAQPIKAEGKMPYVAVNVPTGLTEDRWVQSIEIEPGDRQVVHHVIVFAVDPKQKGERFAQQETFFAAYVPGNNGDIFPTGFAKKLPAGAVLSFQMHYTPNGKATEDRTKIGFRWAKTPPKYELKVASVPNLKLKIPPGDANHVETAERPAPEDMNLVGFMPHMHVRGKAFRYEILQPSGSQVVLDIPRYDFNWQLMYRLNEPLHMPRGTVMKVTATFDNSAGNKANPDPTKTVRWGQQTDDEMMIGYIAYYVPVAGAATAAR